MSESRHLLDSVDLFIITLSPQNIPLTWCQADTGRGDDDRGCRHRTGDSPGGWGMTPPGRGRRRRRRRRSRRSRRSRQGGGVQESVPRKMCTLLGFSLLSLKCMNCDSKVWSMNYEWVRMRSCKRSFIDIHTNSDIWSSWRNSRLIYLFHFIPIDLEFSQFKSV